MPVDTVPLRKPVENERQLWPEALRRWLPDPRLQVTPAELDFRRKTPRPERLGRA
jgi:hypothetical protein